MCALPRRTSVDVRPLERKREGFLPSSPIGEVTAMNLDTTVLLVPGEELFSWTGAHLPSSQGL